MEGPNGPRVLLLNGSRQEIDHQTGRLNVLTFEQNEIDLADSNQERRCPAARHVGSIAARPAATRTRTQCSATCRNGSPRRISGWPAPLTTLSYAHGGAGLGAERAHSAATAGPAAAGRHRRDGWAAGARPRHRQPRGARQRLLFLIWLHAIAAGPGLRLAAVRAAALRAVPTAPGRGSGLTRHDHRRHAVALHRRASSPPRCSAMLLALSGLVAMFDFIELLRRSASKPGRDLRPGQRRSPPCGCPTSPCRSCPSRCCWAASCASGA